MATKKRKRVLNPLPVGRKFKATIQKLAGGKFKIVVPGRGPKVANPGRVRNVEGFYDATGFHPIRSASDYDPDRAGDDYSDVKPRKRKAKKATKKRKR